MVVQDFEIAGSGCDACGGGRSPAGTELTERSWDSHAQYLREPPRPPQPLAPLYCRPRYLLTLQGFCTFIIVVSLTLSNCTYIHHIYIYLSKYSFMGNWFQVPQ